MKTIMDKTGLVNRMRKIRDTLCSEVIEMTFEQEKDYIKKQLVILKQKRSRKVVA
jgi:hypothetical protein